MKTIVFQSFRTHDVPGWMAACMESVRAWAALRGFEYRFLDDRFFDCVPEAVRRKARHPCTLADMARLLTARELLEADCERAIWMDADVLVFAPERLLPEPLPKFALCLEAWLANTPQGARCDYRVNNAVAVFSRDDGYLQFLIEASRNIARTRPALAKLAIGTRLFTQLHRVVPLPLLNNVGMFSPIVMADIAARAGRCLPVYARHLPAPLAAANLCFSLQHTAATDTPQRVADACVETRGEVVNRLIRGHSAREAIEADRHDPQPARAESIRSAPRDTAAAWNSGAAG